MDGRRAFAVDVLACAHCGGRLRLIGTLHDPAVIWKILAHVGMASSGPSPGPAPRRRAPIWFSRARRTPWCLRGEANHVSLVLAQVLAVPAAPAGLRRAGLGA